ncbi:MAG TPA: hypothetical protein VF876_17710 [Burkholderiales bacterium]
MSETDRDKEVAQAYRALGAEEPPRALDEAILAAARRRPARWRVPLSVAAVVVLAVGVTLRMLPHQRDPESVALAPQVIETPRPAALPAEQVGKLERSAPRQAAPRRSQERGASAEAAARAPAEAVARAPAEAVARAPAGGVARAPASGLEKSDAEPAQAAEARARTEALAAAQPQPAAPAAAAAPPALAADSVRDRAAGSAMEQAGERAPVAAAAAPRALASAKPAEPATPEAWLERIAELKKQGREREAQESLAEFKKRYPDHKIPEALTR